MHADVVSHLEKNRMWFNFRVDFLICRCFLHGERSVHQKENTYSFMNNLVVTF